MSSKDSIGNPSDPKKIFKPYDESVNLITPAGYQTLFDELRKLAEVERPKIVDEVHQAAAQGDRSENAEYIYGKKKLREIDRRMRFLKKRLDSSKVIPSSAQKGDQVLFGARVTVENEDGKNKTWYIVGEDEADPSSGKISWKSPVGRALLYKFPGDLATIGTPGGERELLVIKVEY